MSSQPGSDGLIRAEMQKLNHSGLDYSEVESLRESAIRCSGRARDCRAMHHGWARRV